MIFVNSINVSNIHFAWLLIGNTALENFLNVFVLIWRMNSLSQFIGNYDVRIVTTCKQMFYKQSC